MKVVGKKCRLTAEQAEQLVADYRLGQELKASRLAEKYGISVGTVYWYVHGQHKVGPQKRAAGSDAGSLK